MKVFAFIFAFLLLFTVFEIYESHSIPVQKAASSVDGQNVERAQFKSHEEYK